MEQFTEMYTWQHQAMMSKLDKLQSVLDIVVFHINRYEDHIYEISCDAAVEGMKVFAQRLENHYQKMKKEKSATFDPDKLFRIKIYNKPTGERIRYENFVRADFVRTKINIRDYRGAELAHSLLEPPYGLRITIDGERNSNKYFENKSKLYNALYKEFVEDMLGLNQRNKDKVTIYKWSDDWSNYFDAGKEWWGAFFWTIHNPETNMMIVIGASSTD